MQHGGTVGPRRPATTEEIPRFHRSVGPLRETPGVDDPLDSVERVKGFADGGKHVDCSGPCRLKRSIGVDIDTDLAESGTVHVTFTRPSGRPAS